MKNYYRTLPDIYRENHRPSESTIKQIVKKFQQSGSLEDHEVIKYIHSGRK